jgi:hypothetical protein
MAVIVPDYRIYDHSLVQVIWANMATGDTAVEHRVNDKPELVMVQAEGVFNATRVSMLGSLSNVAYVTATDMTQTAIAFTANGAASVLDPYVYWKPVITSGSADNVRVTLSYWVSDAT